jgi:NAD(P)H dehydrogenase (quinone)
MNIFIVYAHPSKKSYTYQVLQKTINILKKENYNIEISDLYAMDFQSDMTEEEYEREGFALLDLPIPADIHEEHKKIAKADYILFIYPVWWSDCPAKLKGWFDRVYTAGYAYKQDSGTEQMKLVDYGIVLCTAGHPNDFLDEIGMSESMRKVMIEDRLGKRFKEKEMYILGGTLELDKNRKIHEQTIEMVIPEIRRYCI